MVVMDHQVPVKPDVTPPTSPEAEKKILQLLDGQKVMVDTGSLPADPPLWYDPVKFRKGQEFARKYYAGVSLAHFVSLLTMLISPAIYKTLIFTQKSETVAKSFKRYIGTLVHVTAWYHGDVWQADHPARRSVQMVRSMHEHGARTANHPEKKGQVSGAGMGQCGPPFARDRPMLDTIYEDAKSNSGCCPYASMRQQVDSEYLFFNQFDMADTQFAFIGVLVLFPKKFGAIYATDDELRGFIHFWRCIGYLLGIQDRFNLCSDDDLESTRNLCRLYLDQMIKPAFKNATTEYEHMARAVAKGACLYYPGVSFESLFAYYAHAVGLPASNFIRRMSYGQYFNFLYLRLVFCVLCWIPGVIALFSAITKFAIGLIVDRQSSRCWPKSWNPPQVEGLDKFWTLPPPQGSGKVRPAAQQPQYSSP